MSGARDFVDAEGGSSRELLIPAKEERTALWTHHCCQGARLVFLLSHGVLLLNASSALSNLEQAHWGALFWPVWVGDGLCAALIVASWFASCPYIQLCLTERQPRSGDHNPSILTEILPQIVLAVIGLIFLLLAFGAEYSLCMYLESVRNGRPESLPAATVLGILVGLLSLCQGALFLPNSATYLSVGASLFGGIIIFAASRGGAWGAQALVLLPALLSIASLLLANAFRIRRHLNVLFKEERLLRWAEVALLGCLLLVTFTLTVKVANGAVAQAGPDVCVAGLTMCFLAALRVRLSYWEASLGYLDDRRFLQEASVAERPNPEVLISMADSSSVAAA